MLTSQRIPTLPGLPTVPLSYGILVSENDVTRSKSALLPQACCWLLLLSVAHPAQSASLNAPPDPPAHTAELPTADAGPPLSLDEASGLSLVDQPILTGREAVINADERQAVAAAQLPDPKLSSGLKEFPIDTGEAFSLRRDNFTEFTVGVSQDFPRGDKRRLRGERKRLEADTERAAPVYSIFTL